MITPITVPDQLSDKLNHMIKPKIIKINSDHDGLRLDIFLVKKLKLSRSQIQKMIATGKITIDEEPPRTAGVKVRAGNNVVIASKAKQSPKTQYKLNPKSKKIASLRSTSLVRLAHLRALSLPAFNSYTKV